MEGKAMSAAVKRLVVAVAAVGLIAGGCNIKVPVWRHCPGGYHRLGSRILHRPTYWCTPDKS